MQVETSTVRTSSTGTQRPAWVQVTECRLSLQRPEDRWDFLQPSRGKLSSTTLIRDTQCRPISSVLSLCRSTNLVLMPWQSSFLVLTVCQGWGHMLEQLVASCGCNSAATKATRLSNSTKSIRTRCTSILRASSPTNTMAEAPKCGRCSARVRPSRTPCQVLRCRSRSTLSRVISPQSASFIPPPQRPPRRPHRPVSTCAASRTLRTRSVASCTKTRQMTSTGLSRVDEHPQAAPDRTAPNLGASTCTSRCLIQ